MPRKVILDDAAVVRAYQDEGMSIFALSKKFGVARQTIKDRLKKTGIRIENRFWKKYTKTTTLFSGEKIETENEAYLLGLYMADGTLNERDQLIGLDLSRRDHEHLERVKLIWGVDNRIGSLKNKFSGSSFLRIYDSRLYQAMCRFGVVPNKSRFGVFPKLDWFRDEDLIRHFIRGYFDGDGCFSYSNITKPQISFVGTKSIVQGIASYCKAEHLTHFNLRPSPENTEESEERAWVIRSGGAIQVRNLMSWLYDKTDLFLKRKHDKYTSFLMGRKIAGYDVQYPTSIFESSPISTSL